MSRFRPPCCMLLQEQFGQSPPHPGGAAQALRGRSGPRARRLRGMSRDFPGSRARGPLPFPAVADQAPGKSSGLPPRSSDRTAASFSAPIAQRRWVPAVLATRKAYVAAQDCSSSRPARADLGRVGQGAGEGVDRLGRDRGRVQVGDGADQQVAARAVLGVRRGHGRRGARASPQPTYARPGRRRGRPRRARRRASSAGRRAWSCGTVRRQLVQLLADRRRHGGEHAGQGAALRRHRRVDQLGVQQLLASSYDGRRGARRRRCAVVGRPVRARGRRALQVGQVQVAQGGHPRGEVAVPRADRSDQPGDLGQLARRPPSTSAPSGSPADPVEVPCRSVARGAGRARRRGAVVESRHTRPARRHRGRPRTPRASYDGWRGGDRRTRRRPYPRRTPGVATSGAGAAIVDDRQQHKEVEHP